MRDKWALIVGITQFSNPKIPKLKYATKDAADFYNYLTHEGQFAPDHVRLLLNEKATQRRIMSELGNKLLARMVKPDDLVVIFFSTHGSPAQMDISHKNFLVAYDSDPDDLYASGIEMQKILEIIKDRVPTDRVLLVLDACHSGGIDPNAKGIGRTGNFKADEIAEGSGKLVICSSQPDEQSWESKRYANGVFTKNLLDGLRSQGQKTPLSQAVEKFRNGVEDEVSQDHPGVKQTPVFRSKWSGNDLVLAVKPAQPVKIPPTVLVDLEPDSVGVGGGADKPKPIAVAMSTSLGKTPLAQEAPEQSAPQTLKLTLDYLCKLNNVPQYTNEKELKSAMTTAFNLKGANPGNSEYKYPAAMLRIQLGQISTANVELQELMVDEANDWHAMLAEPTASTN